MAKKRRSGERIEPVLDSRAARRQGRLEFGLAEEDRPAAAAAPRRKAKPDKPAKSRKAKGRRAGKGSATLVGLVRRTLYWGAVASVWGAVALAVVVGYYAVKLPPTSEWTVPPHAASVQILASNGALITNRSDTSSASLTLDEMPAYLPEAVIAIEDRRFYSHFGIDPIGLLRAAVTNIRAGGVVQGGSTLTQQLAKNLFLTPERTIGRKIQEVVLSFWLEARLTKRQILELYLNRVYLGAGAYGVDAAAHRYFGKSARNVTLAEAATLAGLLKAPSHYSPLTDPDAAEARTQVVLAAMRSAGFITDREASLAMSAPIKPVRDAAGGSGRYVADWVMNVLPGFVGALDHDIIVETTIDMNLQGLAAKAVADTLDEDAGKHGASQGAFVAIDPAGAVKALVGGRDYGTGPYNRAVDARRQPGSAFKPFVYLTALERSLYPETVRVDQPVSIKGWQPKNYSKNYLGPVTLETALADSLNTVSVQLTQEVGPKSVVATARRLGITSPLMATPSIALGTSEVSLLELTGAFVPFANGGRGIIPHVINRIVTADGKLIYQRAGSGPGQVIAPAYVGMMNAMLTAVVTSGTGRKAAISGWPVAGKTGTSQDFRDAWFVGFTGVLTAGAWFGNDDGKPTKNASGSNLPALAWHQFMAGALAGIPPVALPGDYRFGDPSHGARPPVPPDAVGEDGGPSAALPDAGQVPPVATTAAPDQPFGGYAPPLPPPRAAYPVPPADIGRAPALRPPPPGNFFRQLFGG